MLSLLFLLLPGVLSSVCCCGNATIMSSEYCHADSTACQVVETCGSLPRASLSTCSPAMPSEEALAKTMAQRKLLSPRDVAAFYTPDTFLSELLLIAQLYFNAHSTAISQFETLFGLPAGVRDDFEKTFTKFFGELRRIAALFPGGAPAFDVLLKVIDMLGETSEAVRRAKQSGTDFRSCATALRTNLVFTNQKMSTDALDAHRELTTLYNSGTVDRIELLFEAYTMVTAGFEYFEPLRVVQNGIIGGYLSARGSRMQSITITGAYEAHGGWTYTNSQFGSGNTNPITVLNQLVQFNNNCFDANSLGIGFSWVTMHMDGREGFNWNLLCDYDAERRLEGPDCYQGVFPPPDCTDCPWAHGITKDGPFYVDEIRS